jgi:putative NADH-flavin reductase
LHSPKDIAQQMSEFIDLIKNNCLSKIVLISPAKIVEESEITQRYYIGQKRSQ